MAYIFCLTYNLLVQNDHLCHTENVGQVLAKINTYMQTTTLMVPLLYTRIYVIFFNV